MYMNVIFAGPSIAQRPQWVWLLLLHSVGVGGRLGCRGYRGGEGGCGEGV